MKEGGKMKQKLSQTQKLTTNLQLSQTMQNSLDILKMNQNELIDFLNELVEKNPLVEYTPSADMNLMIQDTFSISPSLKDDLLFQLHTCNIKCDISIGEFIIESLDEDGFLTESIEEYAKILKTNKKNVQLAIRTIQSFEPIGVATSDALESIYIQLKYKNLNQAAKILKEYPEELIHKNFSLIAKKEKINIHDVETFMKQIRSCTPCPCLSYNIKPEKIIIPDFTVKVENNDIEIIPKDLGHIQIYENYSKNSFSNPKIREYFDEAHFFIDHLNKRNKTMMILANALIEKQKFHFLYQDELQPCTLLDIANDTGFHESTVSRTLSNKYYEFENELYPVKSLFVSQTKLGSSKDSLLKAIKELISKENLNHPLTDDQIVDILADMDLYISRRAVSKYRKLLNIPNSKQRKGR